MARPRQLMKTLEVPTVVSTRKCVVIRGSSVSISGGNGASATEIIAVTKPLTSVVTANVAEKYKSIGLKERDALFRLSIIGSLIFLRRFFEMGIDAMISDAPFTEISKDVYEQYAYEEGRLAALDYLKTTQED